MIPLLYVTYNITTRVPVNNDWAYHEGTQALSRTPGVYRMSGSVVESGQFASVLLRKECGEFQIV